MARLIYIILFFQLVLTSFSASAQQQLGYCIEGDEIVFTCDVRDYDRVTVENTKVNLEIDDINIKTVSLAGTFNSWSGKGWRLKRRTEHIFELRKKVSDLEVASDGAFKFIINNKFWIEPPLSAANKVPVDVNDLLGGIYNLKLDIATIDSKGNHEFHLPGYPDANEVLLSGTFNNWNENDYRMYRTDTGWQLVLQLPPGIHEYRFIVDGRWMEDPTNQKRVENEFGEYNSVVTTQKKHTFLLKDKGYGEVYLAASFTDWQHQKIPMKLIKDYWVVTQPLSYGRYHYKFMADGEWFLDPENKVTEYAHDGNLNSVVFIK
jgi:1,4-alpha-glucan branching enzyme